MQSVEEFLAYAIKLEEEAAIRFGQLADAMELAGNREVGKLFRQLSTYSKLHHADAVARSGFRSMPAIRSGEFSWPDIESPETAEIWAADPLIGREQALEIALAAEMAGYQFLQTHSRHHHRPRDQDARQGVRPRRERACRRAS